MRPVYGARAWREDGWWLVRVTDASEGADPAPLNALTQARTLAHVEPMARDLVATILDADEGAFDVRVAYALPDDVDDLISQAKAARAWADAAKELWQERSAAAARALAGKGYSLREAAALLGISHQRVDQLLGASVMERAFADSLAGYLSRTAADPVHQVDVVFMVAPSGSEGDRRYVEEADEQFKVELGHALAAWHARLLGRDRGQAEHDDVTAGEPLPAQRDDEVIARAWEIVQA